MMLRCGAGLSSRLSAARGALAAQPIGLRPFETTEMQSTPRRWSSNSNRAPLLEFARKLKAQEKNDRLGREVASPTLNSGKERDFHEPDAMRQYQVPEEELEEDDELRKEMAEEAAAEAAADAKDLDDSLIDEARDGESDVDEQAINITKNYDTDDQFAAAELFSVSQEELDELNKRWEVEIADSDVDEGDRAFLEANKISKERHQRLTQLADEEFRDTDKAIFAVIREYRKEPFQIWKTIKHEQLGAHLKDYHLYAIMKVFSSYVESRPLMPDLLVWARKAVKRPIHRRVCHFAIEALLELDRGEDAVRELSLMHLVSIRPMAHTRTILEEHFSAKLMNLVAADDLQGARKMLNYVRTEGVFASAEAYHAVVDLYIKHERYLMARDVLGKMVTDGEAPDKKRYAAIIGAYVDRGDFEDAADVLEEMDAYQVYAPRALSQMVVDKLKESGSESLEEVEKAARFRHNLKVYHQKLHETYQV